MRHSTLKDILKKYHSKDYYNMKVHASEAQNKFDLKSYNIMIFYRSKNPISWFYPIVNLLMWMVGDDISNDVILHLLGPLSQLVWI